MIVILSPAKTLNFSAARSKLASHPRLLEHTHRLASELRGLSKAQLGKLLGISDSLAALNHGRFKTFSEDAAELGPDAKQAALAYDGDAYRGLMGEDFDDDSLQFMQGRLRVLSGLYGALRPLDLVQPYRLCLGTSLKTPRGSNLYQFWGDLVAQQIKDDLDEQGTVPLLVNCASDEYSKVLRLGHSDSPLADVPLVTCQFLTGGRVLSVYAKRARGLMVRHIVEARVNDLEGLRGFAAEGYKYSGAQSSDERLVFCRASAPAKPAKKAAKKVAKKAATKASAKRTGSDAKGKAKASSKTKPLAAKASIQRTRASTRKRSQA